MRHPLLTARMLAASLLALVAVAACVALGLWQYHVWGQHRSEAASDLAHAPVRPLTALLGPDAPFTTDLVGRRARLKGSWRPDGTVYVSGRRWHGRTGYWVVTPLQVGATGSSMLVVRGWSSTAASPPVGGPATVTGWLQPPEGSGGADPHPGDDVLPQLRIADVIQHVHTDLYGGFVVAHRVVASGRTGNGGTPGTAMRGLAALGPPHLPPPSRFTGLRNLLYGLQWWVFAGFAGFVWWRWVHDELDRSRPHVANEPGGPAPAAERTRQTAAADGDGAAGGPPTLG